MFDDLGCILDLEFIALYGSYVTSYYYMRHANLLTWVYIWQTDGYKRQHTRETPKLQTSALTS